MRNVKKGFKKALAVGLCGIMATSVGNMSLLNANAAKKVKRLSVKSSASVIDIKGTARLSVKGQKVSALRFSIDRKKIAKVDKSGVVKGLRAGKATITVISKKHKNVKGKIVIRVKNIKPTKLSLNYSTIKLQVKKKAIVKAKVSPSGVYCPVSFSSNAKKIATVDKKGVVIARKAGKAVITVKSKEKNNKGKYLIKKVSVKVSAKKVNKPHVKEEKLADGTWYGTGTYSFYYEMSGPDIVKVEVKNGRVVSAQGIKEIEDDGYRHGKNILKSAEGIASTNNLEAQLKNRKGPAYDAVSGATRTAEGHLSALKNALARSRKYYKDKVKQEVAYIDFKTRPNAGAIGEKLDLTGTVMNVFFKDGSKKEVPFAELGKYGIKATPNNGSKLPEKGKTFLVHFVNKDSLIDMPTRIQVQKDYKRAYATHVIIKYKDSTEEKINLTENEFRYKHKTDKEIEKMSIYRNDKFLTDGKLNKYVAGDWEFDLKNISLPNGFDFWGFETYTVNISSDAKSIVSFEVDTKDIKNKYSVGDPLNIDNLKIKATQRNGKIKEFNSWKECEKAGFRAEPNNGYRFTTSDTGENEIQITYQGKSGNINKTFKVNVESDVTNAEVPEKIDLYDKKTNQLITTIELKKNEFVNGGGYLVKYQIKVPKKYEKWDENTFDVRVLNKNGDNLKITTKKKGIILQIFTENYLVNIR